MKLNELDKTFLNYINCKDCDVSYLVGISNQSVDDKGSHGTFDGVGYLAVGFNELTEEIKKEAPCKKCGEMCQVKKSE